MTQKEKTNLIAKVRRIKPDWEVTPLCEKNCAQCDGFRKAKEKVIAVIKGIKVVKIC